jgi:threonyl-tRNA synthetase
MPALTLPDGSIREFEGPVTGLDVALSIGKTLARDAVMIVVDGAQWDLTRAIEHDASIAIITRDSDAGLDLLRHDASHVMAQAVKELYPDAQVTIGPSIEDGFYYDFAHTEHFTPADLESIEQRMGEIVDRDVPITREEWDRNEAVTFFKDWGEQYKAELIESIPGDEPISIYRQGDWLDLCRGPHLPSTGRLGKAFKLMKLAGAYWRGDSRNEMLQRIYGTAWSTDKQLKAYLHRLEEAEKRDHRRLGKQMNLFHLQEEAPGAVFWHPKGWTFFRQLENYMRDAQAAIGYQEVNTPQIMDRGLWEASGHWETFHDHMFTTETEDGRVFALKPMNCPGHVQIFKQGIKSYRDLPIRISEFGRVHRYEPSGALHGLMRVRAFCQDDAHIFCTPDQIMEESKLVCDFILALYRDFGFDDCFVKFSDRPEKRVGSDEVWDTAEEALQEACRVAGVTTTLNPGEGAFYGPKLEFVLRDAIGRDWQCGTLQVDFNLPDRLDAEYVDEHGNRQRPVMLHQANFGSLERFAGILIEHYSGNLPLWLTPVQAKVCTITQDADAYAEKVLCDLRAAGIRAEGDFRNESISYKIRQHSVEKVPVLLVVGKREAEKNTVVIRRLGSKRQSVQALDTATAALCEEIATRGASAQANPSDSAS